MHIFFAYTTKTFAFKSVVFQRRWGTELFFHAKVCISVVSRLFKETCPVKWKPSGLQFINEHCQYKIKTKKIRIFNNNEKIADLCIFIGCWNYLWGICESDPCSCIHYIQDPRRHWGAPAGTAYTSSSICVLWWALILCCLLLLFLLGSSISPLVSCSVSCPSSQFGLFWVFIFLLVALQPQLTAVINGFDTCLISSLPLLDH